MAEQRWFVDHAEHGMDRTMYGIYFGGGVTGYKLDSLHDTIESAQARADQLNQQEN